MKFRRITNLSINSTIPIHPKKIIGALSIFSLILASWMPHSISFLHFLLLGLPVFTISSILLGQRGRVSHFRAGMHLKHLM